MSAKEYVKRYTVFMLGVIACAFGAVFVVKAALGATPITTIPYTMSLIFTGITYGTWVIIFNYTLIVLEVAILRKKTIVSEILIQFGIVFVFGRCIDLFMWMLQGMKPENYIVRLLALVLGCLILAFGASLELMANVAMLPADAFARALALTTTKTFAQWRVYADTSMMVIAAVISLLVMHEMKGMREGSVLCALLVGNMVKWISPLSEKIKIALKL